MAVNADETLVMENTNTAPQFPTPSCRFNLAICYRPHRGAVTSDQIYPGMRAVFVQYRMISIEAKAGGNIFKVQRKPQRFCAERVAASIVETRTAVIVAECDCG